MPAAAQYPPPPPPLPTELPQFAFDGYQFNYYRPIPPPSLQVRAQTVTTTGYADTHYYPSRHPRADTASTTSTTASISASSYGAGNLAAPRRRKRVSTLLAERLGADDSRAAPAGRSTAKTSSNRIDDKPTQPRSPQRPGKQPSLLRHEPRRRTIYIPDDTTVMTIHPGATGTITDNTMRRAASTSTDGVRRREQTPDCGLDLVTLSGDEGVSPLVSVLKESKSGTKTGSVSTLSSTSASAPSAVVRGGQKPVTAKTRKARPGLAAAPKRVPLGESVRSRQSVAFADDVFGADTGKENQPPGVTSRAGKEPVSATSSSMGIKEKAKRRSTMLPSQPGIVRSDSTSSARASILVPATKASIEIERDRIEMEADVRPKLKKRLPSDNGFVSENQRSPRLRKTAAAPTIKKAHAFELGVQRQQSHPEPTASGSSLRAEHARLQAAATKRTAPEVNSAVLSVSLAAAERPQFKAFAQLHQRPTNSLSASISCYSVLPDDLSHPEMYEEHWLEQQEITLTEALNAILVPASTHRRLDDPETAHKELRRKLLALYHKPEFPLLFKRLTASLQYGALSVSKDVIERSLKLRDDVGLKKKFIALFLESYASGVLRAAAEAVVGKQCPLPALRLSEELSEVEKRDKEVRSGGRAVARFLDTFFVQHMDAAKPKAGTIGAIARAADRGASKEEHGSHVWCWRRTVLRSLMLILLLDQAKAKGTLETCMFRGDSPYKSSTTVLQALGMLMIPSLGDVIKPLRNLNYTVATVQYPLQEFDYGIRNLATDLRDGVRLARLIELLLFGATEDDDYPVSRHLRFPCPDKIRKTHNVGVALSALASNGGVASRLCSKLSPEDIVSGHREKTLSLIWGLVSHVGMAALLDKKQLEAEVQRMLVEAFGDQFIEESSLKMEEMDCEELLRFWASAIGARSGLTVANLTTSFADGKVFEAVADTYLPFVPGASGTLAVSTSRATASARSSLSHKLKAIGFTKSFVSLFDVTMGIPSSRSTVTTLSLLASRFLPLLAPHRAAMVIQRSARRFLARRSIRQRIVLMRLAHHCSVIVAARERLVGAASIIQRSWRELLERRHQRLMTDVQRFQILAKGFLVRKAARRAKNRVRVRGGW